MPPLGGKPGGGGGYAGGGPGAGVGPQQSSVGTLVYPAKRDSYFPVDCVEAVVPVLSKRRRLCKGDASPVDAWRIYLALKSGLLAESTWAIDVLNILLFDDSSVHYFSLSYMPGLVEVLLEHFRRCLAQIFTLLDDTEVAHDCGKAKAVEEPWWTWPKRKTLKQKEACGGTFVSTDLGSVTESELSGTRFRMLDGPDWSMNARRRETVGIVARDHELFILDSKKDWDLHDGIDDPSSLNQWHGGSEVSQHIVTHFTAELNLVPFVRLIKDVRNNRHQQLVHDDPATAIQGDSPTELHDPAASIKKEGSTRSEQDLEPADVKDKSNGDVNQEDEEESQEKGDQTRGSMLNNCIVKKEKEEKDGVDCKLQIRDPHATLKRRTMDDFEDECYSRDETSLYMINDSQDQLCRRATALSNIFRSLSFVPGNEQDLAKNSTLLVIIGKLLLLHHDHPLRSGHQKNYDREEDVDFGGGSDSVFSSVTSKDPEWWWETLLCLRENVLVMLANMSGQLDLSLYPEEIVRPLVDGLLHWAVCPSAQAQDPFSSFGSHSTSLLSPQRLCLEALCKLLVMESNMDLVIATPPFSRLEKLVHLLTRSLCRTEDQVLREFSINLLYYLSAADSSMARLIALHNNSLILLVSFVEQAEANALAVASQHGIQALRENPESMGTSLDMLRRAASTLFYISRHPDSRPLLVKLEQRLLALVMSQIMDQSVAALLSKSLYLCNSDDE